MSATAIDQAVSALYATYNAATPDGWNTFDGQPRDPGRKSLCVGWDESGQPAITSTRDLSDIAGESTAETFDVSNLLTLWVGNEPLAQARAELFAAFDTYEAALDADRQLDGTVGLAWSSALEYMGSRRTEGALVQARFTVHIETY